ncbi:MAG: Sec-independent protein translocase protein TatB [Pseudomonadota bacterium]|nr:Sec-independent protein translocase protein TatB [Pseudomonadota bacterium]
MFDLGFSELFLVAIIALIVLGPERLPKAARFAGLWMRRARSQWQSVKSEFENEIADEQLRNTLKQTREDLQEARDSIVRSGQDMQREFTDIGAAARDLNNNSATASPAGIAAVATGAVPAEDASPATEATVAEPAVAGDNYYLEELDEDPYPDGFPGTNMINNAGSDGQR